MKKLSILAIGAAGYVLGARAGRGRYEQIKQQATKAWNTAPVQSAKDDVASAAQQAATSVKDQVVNTVKDKVDDKRTSTEDLAGGGLS